MIRHPYSGRAIFHHQPKTAGQAVNVWLQRHLGAGTVTPNLIGYHRALIRQYGGEYPVLSGHLGFDGSGLDPRYTYFTVLREPVDRMISWLFYVDRDSGLTDGTRELKAGARLFLETEGEQSSVEFLDSARNPYVENFRRVVMGCEAGDAYKLQVAQEVVEAYALVGFYEQLPAFVDALAVLLQVPQHTPLSAVNVTSRRLACDQVSGRMLDNILKLTDLDRAFYARMLQMACKKAVQSDRLSAIPYTREFQTWPANTPPTRPVWTNAYLDIYAPTSLPTQNGVIRGTAIISDERPGFLSLGSRFILGPGQYQMGAVGRFETPGASCQADVRCDAGQTLLVSKTMSSPTAPNPANFAVGVSFSLDATKLDVEFRFATPAQHKVRLDALYLLRCEALDVQLKRAGEQLLADAGPTERETTLMMLKPEQFNTKAGERVGSTLQSSGVDGPLCFGPYLPLGRGRYRAALVGSVGPRGLGGAYADVGFKRGQQIVHLQPLSITPFNEEADFIGQPWTFTLEQDVEDLEIRLWITQRSQINLAGVILSRLGDVEPLLVTVSVPETVVQTETEAADHAD